MNQTLLHALCKWHELCPCEYIGFLNRVIDNSGSIIRHLTAIRPVGLIAVILRRIVGSRDHNACVAFVIPGCEAERRDRHQFIIDPYLNAVGRQNTRRVPCKIPALQPAVIADGNRLRTALRLHPVCYTLCSLPHNPDIHAVCAGSQSTPESCRAELQSNRKALAYGIIISLYIQQFLLKIKINQICFQPAFVVLRIHNLLLPC